MRRQVAQRLTQIQAVYTQTISPILSNIEAIWKWENLASWQFIWQAKG